MSIGVADCVPTAKQRWAHFLREQLQEKEPERYERTVERMMRQMGQEEEHNKKVTNKKVTPSPTSVTSNYQEGGSSGSNDGRSSRC